MIIEYFYSHKSRPLHLITRSATVAAMAESVSTWSMPTPKTDSVWRVRDTTLLIGISIRNILKPTRSLYDFRSESYDSNSGFYVVGDLDLCPMFYLFVIRTGHDVLASPCEDS